MVSYVMFYVISMFMNVCVSASTCVAYAFSLVLDPPIVCLLHPILVCLFVFYFIILDACLYYNERKRRVLDIGGWRIKGDLGGAGG